MTVITPTTTRPTTRARTVAFTGRNASMPLTLVSIAPYAFTPMIEMRASTEMSTTIVPKPGKRLSPTCLIDEIASTFGMRLESSPPRPISHTADPAAPR